jgi:hypothetical protein
MSPIHTRMRLPIALVLAALMLSSPLALALPEDPGREDGPTPTLILGPDPPLVVVAPHEWKDELQPYLDWRERTMGHTPWFYPYEEVVAQGTGWDAAAKLKSLLPHCWTGDGGLMNILIVGDADVIPVRKVFVDITGDGNTSDPLNFRWTDD